MNSFLKKLGSILSKVAGVAASVGPILLPFLGASQAAELIHVGLNDLTSIGSAALQIETALQGKAGTEKLTALIPLVGNIISTSELVAGKKVSNEALFTKAIQEYAQATVDLLNSIDESEAKTA